MSQDNFKRRTHTLQIGLLLMFFFMVLGAFFLSEYQSYPDSIDRKYIDENRREILRRDLIESRNSSKMSQRIKSYEYLKSNNIPEGQETVRADSKQQALQEESARQRGEKIISEREDMALANDELPPSNNAKLKSKSISEYWKKYSN
ncbi:MAG: hypothetical protein ACI4ND_01510, partial [Succinivibrio sp.]